MSADPPPAAVSPDSEVPPVQTNGLAVLGITAAVVLLSLFAALVSAGLWDPHELRVAELARRIAVNVFSASQLARDGADNSMVDLGDLGSGELPFTSMALGFRVFGLHEWAGRLPLAIWGAAGTLAVFASVARLTDRLTGAFAAIVLVTTPLFFVQVRTMLGDGVTLSAVAIAFGGLAVGVFDSSRDWRPRLLGVVVGLLGLGAAYLCRGPWLGLLVPAGGVALGWAVVRGNGGETDRFGDVVGVASAVVAVIGLVAGAVALHGAFADPGRFRLLVGVPLVQPTKLPTFDAVVRELGHGLFPYSGLVPFALGRLTLAPTCSQPVARRESALRVALLAVLGLGIAVSGVLSTWTAPVPFVAVFAIAGIIALALRDLERRSPVSAGMAVGTVAFTVLIAWDYKSFPELSFAPFGISPESYPESLVATVERVAKGLAVLVSGVVFLSFIERSERSASRFRLGDYTAWPKVLWSAQQGNLLFAAVVMEAALIGTAGLLWLSDQFFHWPQFSVWSANTRLAARTGWILFPFLVFVVPAAGLAIRDSCRALFAWTGVGRVRVVLTSLAAAGLVLSLGYYPALAKQLSPRRVFAAFGARAKPGDPVALFGVGKQNAIYYADREVTVLPSSRAAHQWLAADSGRRWLIMRRDELPAINSHHRGAREGTNLPIIQAGSSEFLLAVNELLPGEVNANPLRDIVLEGVVEPARPVSANLAGKLDVLGWEIVSATGAVTDELVPGTSYEFRIYWRVVGRIGGDWETFIHIDGHGQRHNGDHETVGGRYPMFLWLPGDVIRDTHPFSLEPNFAPGIYDVYFGLFSGNRRLEVKRGKHADDRVFGGKIRVR